MDPILPCGWPWPLGPRVLQSPPEVFLMSEYSQWAKCQCSGLHPAPSSPSPCVVPSSLTYCRANTLPVNSVFFHPSELSLDCDLGASSCRCLKSSSAVLPQRSLPATPAMFACCSGPHILSACQSPGPPGTTADS